LATAERIPGLAEVMAAVNRTRSRWDSWVETLSGEEAQQRLWSEEVVEELRESVCRALDGRRTQGTVPEPRGPSATTHLSVIDGDGLAVSLTHTAGESAGFVVPGTGFIPNNMMGEADLHPRGFHQTIPGARILTMMAPTVLTAPNLGCVALGSGGSTRIRSAMLQVIHHLVDGGLSLRDAVEEPRVHYESGILQIEGGVSPESIDVARRLGYELNLWPGLHLYFGGANAVCRAPDGSLEGCGDPRRGGASRSVSRG
jgi:gamma-glutamyltranspeptidase/glutathione hydrolase